MADKTLFDKIVDGEIPSHKVWEDEKYLAFLTPFPSTPGATVVIPKQNPGDYVFTADEDIVAGLMLACRQVARLLEKAFTTDRVALVFEGQEVPHLHAKLYPMHEARGDRSKFPKHEVFFPVYPGYTMTANGPKMDDAELAAISQKIREASDEN
jgi:histidine triad (HIT) family protein